MWMLDNKTISTRFRQCYAEALNSLDPSTQNGAILVNPDQYMIGHGWNHFPAGVNEAHWHGEKDAKYARVVHAEVAALLSAARTGHATKGSTLYCPWAACANCAKHIADAGVATLIRHTSSNAAGVTGGHWVQDCVIGDEIMLEAGIRIFEASPAMWLMPLRRNGEEWIWSDNDSNPALTLITEAGQNFERT